MKSNRAVLDPASIQPSMRILFVDDCFQDYHLISLLLNSETDTQYDSAWARNSDEAKAKLGAESFDVVAVDYNLGPERGSEVIEKLHVMYPKSVYILITGIEDPKIYRKGIKAGADNFAVKGSECGVVIDRLAQYSVQKKRLQVALKSANASKDWLMSVLAKDLCNPLSALHGMLSNASRTSSEMPREMLEDVLETAMNSSAAAVVVSNQLIEWGRSVNGSLVPSLDYMELSEIVDSSIRLIQPVSDEKGVFLTRKGTFGVKVYADHRMLSTVIRNLVAEAVRVSAHDETVFLVSSVGDSELTFSVELTPAVAYGSGRSLESDELKIDSNSKTREMNLHVCRHLLDAHGRCLFVDENKSRISYSFSLPLRSEGFDTNGQVPIGIHPRM